MVKTMKTPQGFLGFCLMALLLIFMVFAPELAPNDPEKINATLRFSAPSDTFPLGNDQVGRCVYSRLIYGTRYSLGIALPALGLLTLVGLVLGIASSYLGGRTDAILLVLCDIFMAFPSLLIAMSLIGSWGNSVGNIILSVVISSWAWYVRIIRALSLSEIGKDYVLAAKISGSTSWNIMISHILPNIIPHFIVYLCTGVASMILMVSSFSFLGLGLPLGTPEWGAMLSEAKSSIYSAPQLIVLPGVCIFGSALGFTLFGEAYREARFGEDVLL